VTDETASSFRGVKIGERFFFRSLGADRGGSQNCDRSRRGQQPEQLKQQSRRASRLRFIGRSVGPVRR